MRVEEAGDEVFTTQVKGEPSIRGTALTIRNHFRDTGFAEGMVIKSALGKFRDQEAPVIYIGATADALSRHTIPDQDLRSGCLPGGAIIAGLLRAVGVH